VRITPGLPPLSDQTGRFANTGSGQTQGQAGKKRRFPQGSSSESFTVEIVAAASPSSVPASQTFDVDVHYNGSLAAALAAVAKAALPAAEVLLGAKQYTITEHLAVPSGTSIKGAGATATTLTFSLRPPRRGEPAAAFEMVKHAPQISTAVTCMQSLVSALPLHPTIPITSLVVCCNVGRSALL